MTPEEVRATLYRRRRGRGWTQQDVGDRLGVTQAAVSEWERGVHSPTLATVERWANVLGMSLRLVEVVGGADIP